MKSTKVNVLLLFIGVFLLIGYKVEAKPEHRTEFQVFQQFLKYAKKQQSDFDKNDFNKIIDILALPQHLTRNSFEEFNLERKVLACVTCRSVFNVFIRLRKEGKSDEQISAVAIDLCTLMGIQTENVCRGLVYLNLDIILYIIDNEDKFTAEAMCGVLLQSENEKICPYEDERFEWSIDIPSKLDLKTQNSHRFIKADTTFKILHLTDIHYDPAYEAFGLADCNEPTCCRVGQAQRETARKSVHGVYDDGAIKGGVQSDWENNYYLDLKYAELVRAIREKGEGQSQNNVSNGSKAGYWGDYRSCDTPWWAVEDGIDFITENHNSFEYVYYTGDTIDHGVWETTEELITESIIKATDKLKEAFGNTPVYQVIGNHESQPTNQFAPSTIHEASLSTSWLYNLLWEQWKQWLPAEAEETLKKGGYYTALPQPGLRVIVLNSNQCYRFNWWVLYNPKYPQEQLAWMVQVLLQAETNYEKVHILSHIPVGTPDCVAVYTREYKKIIERFADIITAEFNGHTHNDEFKVFYTKESGQPILTAWNGGSLTAYTDVNPNYRIYEVDSSTYEILNMETWVYNLTEANQTPYQRPRWYLEYTFREKYNVSSLSPQDMDALLERLVTVDQDLLVNDYHHFRGKSSDPYINRLCNDACVKNNLNYFFVTELHDNKKYHEMYSKYLANKIK